jgi:hypothetical protein
MAEFNQEQAIKDYTRLMEAGPLAENEEVLSRLVEQAYAYGLYFEYDRDKRSYVLMSKQKGVNTMAEFNHAAVEALRQALDQQRKYEAENWPFVGEDNKPTGSGESITYHLASLYQWSPEYVLTLPPEQRDERLREIWRSFMVAGDIIHRYESAATALLEQPLAALESERPDRPFKAWLATQASPRNPIGYFAHKAINDPQFPERGTEATYREYVRAHTLPYGIYSNWEGEAGLHNAWLNFQEHERQA